MFSSDKAGHLLQCVGSANDRSPAGDTQVARVGVTVVTDDVTLQDYQITDIDSYLVYIWFLPGHTAAVSWAASQSRNTRDTPDDCLKGKQRD